MKKKSFIVTLVLITVIATTATVFAKNLIPNGTQHMIDEGYTQEEACNILMILSSGKENVSALINAKYKELGSWEKVRAYYGISEKDYAEFESWQTDCIEIPDEIYNEMKGKGLSDQECEQLARNAKSFDYDINFVWDSYLKGKTIDDLIKEDTEKKNMQSQAAADLTFGKITDDEFLAKMKDISPEMAMSDVLEFAAKERKEYREMRINGSGITEIEINAAKAAGMTDIFEMCRLKTASKFSNKTFNEMVSKINLGEKATDVIADSVSIEKVNKAKSITAEEFDEK